MQIQFHRTGEARYGVVVVRKGEEPLRMNSAPGFDTRMPHDLQHYIVEKALGIKLGIFGQLAAGGTAGTFEQRYALKNRTTTRHQRHAKSKGSQLLDQGYEDAMRSERATYVCWQHWLASIQDPKALDMADNAASVLASMPTAERKQFSPALLIQTDTMMQTLSEQWSMLQVGEFIEVDW